MEVKSTEWRPGPTVCRCCLSEGCYKDISTEYFWMGKREVYAEMLSETFDVTIGFSKSGGPNSNSRLICEPCISRLRDASEFKRQVLECEKTFMQHLDPGTSTSADLDITVDTDKEVKLERVKTEKRLSDDDFDDRVGFDDDDDDDDLDDEPLTKLASKVPKKESVDLLDLLDNAKVAEKRKSTAKTKSTPAKKSKKETIQPTPSKSVKIEKKKKAGRYDPTRSNAATILKYTTAHPFRVNDKCILCAYCHDMYEDPDEFRQHMDQEHATFNVNVAFHNLPKTEFIKVDVADLRCRICTRRFDDPNTIADHLIMEHKQKIDWDGKLGVMPYLLQRDVFNCAVCKKNFPSLFHLNRHTITHFLSYVCHVCGSSYIATTGLLRHVRSKHQDYEVVCKNCRKVFPTMKAKERHRRTEKSCMPYCCTKCPERFLDFRTRQKHLETAHGYSKRTYRCGDCDTNFANELAYYEHFKLHHSKDCAVCKHCGLKFISANRLKRHMVKHTF